MKNKFILVLLSTLIIQNLSCGKKTTTDEMLANHDSLNIEMPTVDDEDTTIIYSELPEISQEGKNMLTLVIDTSNWVPHSNVQAICSGYTDGSFFINGRRKFGRNESSFNITVDTLLVVGENYFSMNKAFLQYAYFPYPENTYKPIYNMSGKLVFTKIDTANQIISGEFSFTALNRMNMDTLEVKDGRFDLSFNYCK